MGIVNEYIKKLMGFLKKDNEKYEKEWFRYYKDIPQHLNYYNGSIYDKIRETSIENKHRKAIKYFGNEWTYDKFLKKIDEVSAALMQYNIVENECVTICMPNTPESFALIYAINKIGAIANIVHPLSSLADVERALKEANSNILFCSDVSMTKCRRIDVQHFIMVPTSQSFNKILKVLYEIKNKNNFLLDEKMIDWNTFIQNKTEIDYHSKRTGEDPAAIIYSGGTTGKPKGIIISNMNFNAMALQTKNVCDEIKPGNSVLSALPIFHVFGLAVCVHTCLSAGMTCIVVPRLNTKNINKDLKKYKPNVYPAVPSLLRLSLKKNNHLKYDFSKIKIVVVGGDYLPPDLKKEFENFMHDNGSEAIVKVGYGLSEATGFSCCTAPLDENDVIKGTLGIPNPDMDIKIFEINSEAEKVYNEIGEICISGPTIMMGYINEDEETKKTLVKHSDGRIWLHTGDLGYIDPTGRIFYSSRLKRMIIANGYNIYPIELEDIISKCELVSSVTVVGIPHKTKGQTPKAVITLKEGIEDNLDTRSRIRKYFKENLANYAVPSELEIRNSIPMTAVGKVAYRDLEKESLKDNNS